MSYSSPVDGSRAASDAIRGEGRSLVVILVLCHISAPLDGHVDRPLVYTAMKK